MSDLHNVDIGPDDIRTELLNKDLIIKGRNKFIVMASDQSDSNKHSSITTPEATCTDGNSSVPKDASLPDATMRLTELRM